MTLNQLRYVIEISKSGSINKAAGNLFISQSVLSTSIKSLENELGREIFSRSPRGIQITPFGKTFISYISPLYMQLKQLDDMLFRVDSSPSMTLSIASNGFHFLTNICAQLYQKYNSAGIRIEEYEGFGPEVMTLVANDTAEIALVRQWTCYKSQYSKQYRALKLQFHLLATLDIGITVGPKNPLYYSKENSVTADMLDPYPSILYSYLDYGPYSDIMDRLRLSPGHNRFVTSSRANIYETLELTDAYYLNSNYNYLSDSTRSALYETPSRRRTLLLRDCDIKSELGWVVKSNATLTPIASEAIELISELFLSSD